MSINTKRELLLRISREYLAAGKKRRSKLLDSLIEATGYNRKYAIQLLNQAPSKKIHQRRTRTSKYGSEVIDAVSLLWRAANGICAKRLLPFLPTLIETLERFGHLTWGKPLKKKVLEMSLSTLERILKKERAKVSKGKSLTRPGSLLKKQVEVKTFAEWNDQQIGFFEVDLVAHCGGDISGKFVHTLTMTDIATGWTEIVPLLNGASNSVRAGMEHAIELLPFKLKGIDCDNGREFLNHEMVAWCRARKITFTRSRAYRKNDQAHVEEKNGSVVRRLVGYERFEGNQSLEVMKRLYSVSRLYINYFQPSMKLIKKTRVGAKVTKEYDEAKTPLERFLSSETISQSRKLKLLREFRGLDPLSLLAEMARLQSKLWELKSEPSNRPSDASTVTSSRPAQQDATTQRQKDCFGANSSMASNKYSIPKQAASKRAIRNSRASGKWRMQDVRVEITEQFVCDATAPLRGQVIHRDSKLIGFGLRLTGGGSKSYVVETKVNGLTRRVTIGRADLFSVEEARQEAVLMLRQMTSGVTPLSLRKKKKK